MPAESAAELLSVERERNLSSTVNVPHAATDDQMLPSSAAGLFNYLFVLGICSNSAGFIGLRVL